MSSSLLSPARRVLYEANPNLYAFGNTPAHNALAGVDLDESRVLKVLFLGCGDLRNPLTTATCSGHSGKLQIHVNDNSLAIIGRNILILKIISSPKFNPDTTKDMAYLWDVWYNSTWPQSTLKRFLKDIRSLLNETLPDTIVIPKKSFLEDLKELWKFWLSVPKSFTCEKVLEERRNFMMNGFTRITTGRQSTGTMSFSEAVETAVERVERTLLAFGNINNSRSQQQIRGTVRQDIAEYFRTGMTGAGRTASSSVNPTMLQPVTGKWIVHYAGCPLEGYLPIPLKELETKSSSKNDGSGTVFAYCRNELKKLLIAFRKGMEHLKFVFHPCDALAFCYEDSTGGFDVIDTSNLADHMGLINVLIATSRKLRSDHSVLITENIKWDTLFPSLAQYVQEVLCCPLSLIPTLYGLRLKDDIELGPEVISTSPTGSSSRLRWMKALPFHGVPLTLSPILEQSLERLKTACFFPSGTDSSASLEIFNSPLTFHYVLSDLVRRGGSPTLLNWPSLASLPSAFCTGVDTIQAWMMEDTKKPSRLWMVEVTMPFKLLDQQFSGKDPVLRLVLVPTSKFYPVVFWEGFSAINRFFDLNSTESHFIDHFGLRLNLKPGGGIEEVSLTFLLKDRSIMESHYGFIIDCVTSRPVFTIGPLSDFRCQVELLDRPYPWVRREKPSIRNGSKLTGESCEESEGGYKIRLKIRHPPEGGIVPRKSPSELKVATIDESWHRSAHRITVSLDGNKPLPITLPWPILPDTIKATLRLEEGIVRIVASKALRELWPDEENSGSRFRWNAEKLQPWTDMEALGVHMASQFSLDHHLQSGTGSSLTRVREIIRTLFLGTVRDGHQFYSLRVKGWKERSPDLFIRTHPPIRISPQGTPILLLSAVDHRLTEKLKFNRIFPPSERIVPILAYTQEEVELFRYVLRLNSTKIRPTSWQNENLPKEDRGRPCWLATFVRPLYPDRGLTSDEELLGTSATADCCRFLLKFFLLPIFVLFVLYYLVV